MTPPDSRLRSVDRRDEWRVATGQRWERLTGNGCPIGEPITVAEIRDQSVVFAEPVVTAGVEVTAAHLSLFLPGSTYRLVEKTS